VGKKEKSGGRVRVLGKREGERRFTDREGDGHDEKWMRCRSWRGEGGETRAQSGKRKVLIGQGAAEERCRETFPPAKKERRWRWNVWNLPPIHSLISRPQRGGKGGKNVLVQGKGGLSFWQFEGKTEKKGHVSSPRATTGRRRESPHSSRL